MKKIIKNIAKFFLITILVTGGIVLILDVFILLNTKNQIITPEEAAKKTDVDCILVLGCGVYANGTPSPMLRDRLDIALDVYGKEAAPKLLMSGDHGDIYYNEVSAMKKYAMNNGVTDSADIFMDHAGFSTYESLYRAKEVFGVKKVIIVSSTYHLNRALYIAKHLGIEAYGVGADDVYSGSSYREMREILARDKDFIKCIYKPEPTFLGDKIDIHGDGNVTDI
ncbi:MAG: YdcF family protein [Eubacterium sp.]|nr:YdcF family protein [Eubacterium sp.]